MVPRGPLFLSNRKQRLTSQESLLFSYLYNNVILLPMAARELSSVRELWPAGAGRIWRRWRGWHVKGATCDIPWHPCTNMHESRPKGWGDVARMVWHCFQGSVQKWSISSCACSSRLLSVSTTSLYAPNRGGGIHSRSRGWSGYIGISAKWEDMTWSDGGGRLAGDVCVWGEKGERSMRLRTQWRPRITTLERVAYTR